MNKAGRLVSPGFVEQVTSPPEASDWEQEGVAIFTTRRVRRNRYCDVRLRPIRDLNPLELMLVHRSNCAPISERIAIGIVDSVRGDELARTGYKSLLLRLQICHVMPFHSQQRPNDNQEAWAMTEKSWTAHPSGINLS